MVPEMMSTVDTGLPEYVLGCTSRSSSMYRVSGMADMWVALTRPTVDVPRHSISSRLFWKGGERATLDVISKQREKNEISEEINKTLKPSENCIVFLFRYRKTQGEAVVLLGLGQNFKKNEYFHWSKVLAEVNSCSFQDYLHNS